MPLVLTPTSGTYSHPSGTGEGTVFSITSTNNNLVKSIWLDTTNLTVNTTIRVKYQIDGTNSRTFQTIVWTTGMDDGVLIEGEIPINDTLTVTVQSASAEGASRDIPYQYWTEGIGSGSVQFTYTVTSSADGSPIDNCHVWATSDASGNNIVADGYTDSNGQVVFTLDPMTAYFWRSHASFNFSNPDTETVS